MAITPNTGVRLLKVPISLDNKNQLTFSNKNEQYHYFDSLEKIEIDDVTYQRKDNVIRFPAHIDDIIQYNYVMYQNLNYGDKWFYAFIENMRYVNDAMTEISITTDTFQTWQFDLTYHRMFVEREHVNDDTTGKNTVPENLETGEYLVDNLLSYNFNEMCYIIQVTEWATETEDTPLATNLGGVFSAGGAYICDNIRQVVNIINSYPSDARADAIFSVYMIPKAIINNASTTKDMKFSQNSPVYLDYTVNKPTSLNGYIPKNKKLLTFPFCFLNVSNNNGSANTYHYELFNTHNCRFTIKGVPTVGGSIKCCPYEYKNHDESINEEEGLMCGKFPTLSWSEDAYTNWLTQNSVNIAIGTASSLITTLGGAGLMATGGGATAGASSIVSGSLAIASQLGEVYQHSLTPNTAKGNTNGGDINSSSNSNTFFFYQMSIKEEFAKIIDDFFSMYGYKVNCLKVPNIKGRKNWNYVKTIDCNVNGDIPQDDLQQIKNMFDNGVCLWHNPTTFLDYSQSNNIV